MNDNLKKLLIKHEGLKLFPYVDTVGKMTIGVGHNLSDNGITEAQAMALLEDDINKIMPALYKIFPAFNQFSTARQYALVSMIFNLGEPKFDQFNKMIEAINAGNWQKASEQALSSKWASQVKGRAIEISHALMTGQLSSFNITKEY